MSIENLFAQFDSGGFTSAEQRKNLLLKLKHSVQNHEDSIYRALKADLNKSRFESYLTEIGLIYSEIDYSIKNLSKWMKPRKTLGSPAFFPSKNYVIPVPYGVSLIMAPWNYPFMLSLIPLTGALAAGCCAFVKPSEFAPESAAVIKDIIDGAFNCERVLCGLGDAEYAASLTHMRWNHIFFTGSSSVGRKVMQAASENLTPVTLELGGKSPVIVHKDADIKMASRRIVWGKILNAGQTCIAPDYMYVHRSIRDKLIDRMKADLEKMLGDPLNNPDYPKIINDKHFNRLKSYIDSSSVITGGETHPKKRLIAPTLLDSPSKSATVMRDEIFGPVLPVFSYDEIEEPLNFIKSRGKPLAFYVFTHDKRLQKMVTLDTPFGGGCINDTMLHVAGKNLPFGGIGESGMGRYHGEYSFETFSHLKGIVKRGTWIEFPFRFAPYKWLKVLKRML